MSDPVWDTKRKRRRSALKSPPLRLPGQSDDERMSELKDKFGVLLVIPLCFVVLALFEWVRWWTAAQPNPYVPTVRALIAILYAWSKGVPLLANIKNLRLGRDGERAVGQMLEQLRGTGYQVFHDIPGDGLNIAHVIVGPADVFTIETKTRSKPTRGGS